MRTGRNNFSGYALLELMIVIAIIGVITAQLIPLYSKFIEKSKAEAELTNEYFEELDAILEGLSEDQIAVDYDFE